MLCENPKKVLVTADGCGACDEWKDKLAPQIGRGEVEVARVESDYGADLIVAAEKHPDWPQKFKGTPQAVLVCDVNDVTPVDVEDWVQ